MSSSKKIKVAVGLSGGVDSSVAALLLKEAGYEVFGLFMKNWEEDDECPQAQDYQDVVSVAHHLNIPFYTSSFAKEYRELVFQNLIDGLNRGVTPNPDILCNREIKFSLLLERAKALGADFLATGHYARVSEEGALLKGLDPLKDQSYFLYTLKEEILKQTLFPVGSIEKKEVRKIAAKAGLATSQKKDSTGICFIGKRDFGDFMKKYIPTQKGEMVDPFGNIKGKHEGLAFYTLGQRKGLGIGGEGDAWFVYAKEMETNRLRVVQGENHPLLFSRSLITETPSWVKEPPMLPYRCMAKVRYRQEDQSCTVQQQECGLLVTFDKPQRSVTPGQSCVFYQGDRCLGGAIIASIKE